MEQNMKKIFALILLSAVSLLSLAFAAPAVASTNTTATASPTSSSYAAPPMVPNATITSRPIPKPKVASPAGGVAAGDGSTLGGRINGTMLGMRNGI